MSGPFFNEQLGVFSAHDRRTFFGEFKKEMVVSIATMGQFFNDA
jgi:hypothetical protein